MLKRQHIALSCALSLRAKWKRRKSCFHSASRQTGFRKSVKFKCKKNPFHGVRYMHQKLGKAERKIEIKTDTLKTYSGHAGGSVRRAKCYLWLEWLCKLSLSSNFQTVIHWLFHHHRQTPAHTHTLDSEHENNS